MPVYEVIEAVYGVPRDLLWSKEWYRDKRWVEAKGAFIHIATEHANVSMRRMSIDLGVRTPSAMVVTLRTFRNECSDRPAMMARRKRAETLYIERISR